MASLHLTSGTPTANGDQAIDSEQGPEATGFLSLAPDIRNEIYEMVYRFHNRSPTQIVVSAEKGAREVPSALSRTCRQIRSETLAYFFEKSTVVISVVTPADLHACKEWINFTPEHAMEMIRSVRIKSTHKIRPRSIKPHRSNGRCIVNFELNLDDHGPRHTTYWGHGSDVCGICSPKYHALSLVSRVKSIMEEMYYESKITRRVLQSLLAVFETVSAQEKRLHLLPIPGVQEQLLLTMSRPT